MAPTQGQTAILEGKDDLLTVIIAKESVRSEAHSEPHVSPAQADPVLYGALDDGRDHGGSFPRNA